MIFRRKGWLRKEFDEKFLHQLDQSRVDWQQQKMLLEKSFDPSPEVVCDTKLAEAKYFFLLKEAKERNISITR